MKASYVDHMGDDRRVVEAARLSFSKDVKEFGDKEERLIEYLAKHDHWSPFSHTAISLRVTAPVPIRTQCFKSKVGFSENEESRRYISSRPELFVPEYFREKPEGSIKQGSGGKHPRSDHWIGHYKRDCEMMINTYELMIKDGVAPEQARFILPQGVEVNWIWTGSVAAYARYYKLRAESHSQKESQDLANMISDIIQPLFPVSWKVLTR